MKDKILQTSVTSHIEAIAEALHSYSDKQIFCQILIGTRDEHMKGHPDTYHVKVDYGHPYQRDSEPILTANARITYSIDDRRELIRSVEPIRKEGEEDE